MVFFLPVCVQSPPYSSGGSYDSVKMELSAEDLSMGRHGSQIAPDDDDDDHDDHDDNDKINDAEGVDPERLKAFNVSRNILQVSDGKLMKSFRGRKMELQRVSASCSLADLVSWRLVESSLVQLSESSHSAWREIMGELDFHNNKPLDTLQLLLWSFLCFCFYFAILEPKL